MPDAPFVVDALTATFEGVKLPIGLVVRTLNVTGSGLSVASNPVAISMPSAGRFEAIVDEAAIVAFLTAKAPGGLKDFEVELADGAVRVLAVLKVLVEIRAAAVCRLVIRDGRQLVVELESADVLAIGAKSLIKGQIDQLNPLFDVRQLPLPALLETVAVEDGIIRLTGTIAPPE